MAWLLTSALSRVEWVEFDGLGHMGPITHPKVVNEVISGFLAKQMRAANWSRSEAGHHRALELGLHKLADRIGLVDLDQLGDPELVLVLQHQQHAPAIGRVVGDAEPGAFLQVFELA